MAQELAVNVYFAHPYHSWERGLNEHTNRLIRQYFTKGSSLEDITDKQIKAVTDKLNNRPRKCLESKTP
jgi:IS30 family transposase